MRPYLAPEMVINVLSPIIPEYQLKYYASEGNPEQQKVIIDEFNKILGSAKDNAYIK